MRIIEQQIRQIIREEIRKISEQDDANSSGSMPPNPFSLNKVAYTALKKYLRARSKFVGYVPYNDSTSPNPREEVKAIFSDTSSEKHIVWEIDGQGNARMTSFHCATVTGMSPIKEALIGSISLKNAVGSEAYYVKNSINVIQGIFSSAAGVLSSSNPEHVKIVDAICRGKKIHIAVTGTFLLTDTRTASGMSSAPPNTQSILLNLVPVQPPAN